MTGPVVHLANGSGTACGRRAGGWSIDSTVRVDCERCRGTLRFTLRRLEEQGKRLPISYRDLMDTHRQRVRKL